jgi:hypothetical protein
MGKTVGKFVARKDLLDARRAWEDTNTTEKKSSKGSHDRIKIMGAKRA